MSGFLCRPHPDMLTTAVPGRAPGTTPLEVKLVELEQELRRLDVEVHIERQLAAHKLEEGLRRQGFANAAAVRPLPPVLDYPRTHRRATGR